MSWVRYLYKNDMIRRPNLPPPSLKMNFKTPLQDENHTVYFKFDCEYRYRIWCNNNIKIIELIVIDVAKTWLNQDVVFSKARRFYFKWSKRP